MEQNYTKIVTVNKSRGNQDFYNGNKIVTTVEFFSNPIEFWSAPEIFELFLLMTELTRRAILWLLVFGATFVTFSFFQELNLIFFQKLKTQNTRFDMKSELL